jgi:hypothetical protein
MGIFILRETHAIWGMTGSNAVTVNTTMNTVFGMNPVLETVVVVIIIGLVLLFLTLSVSMGFG